MPKSPKISAALKKKHSGEFAISLAGKIIAVGKNSLIAFKKAKKIMPSIEKEEFLVSRIPSQYFRV